MARQKDHKPRMKVYQEQYRVLTERLVETGFIWQGSLQWRMLTCGKMNCACRTDPEARHGPYPYWTRKEKQKTVSKLLSTEEAELYEEWIDNRRQLERIVRAMQKLSRRAARTELSLRAKSRKSVQRRQ